MAKTLKYCSLIAVALLFICFASVYISPATIWFLAYFGLFFQLIFIANLILLIVWCIRRNRKYIIIHAVAFVPGLFFAGYFVQIFNSNGDSSGENKIKLLSYNVQGFKIPYQKNTTQKDIADFINRENPDIICLQEFYTNDKHSEELFCQLLENYRYHSVYYSVIRRNTSYGIATFSRYPIKMTLDIPFENSANAAIYTDIDINGKLLRVYNVHFQSIRLNIKNLLSGKTNRMDEIEEVSSRLKTAFIKRAGQVDLVSKHIDASPLPIVICGDFNDTPVSYTYNKLKGGRLDTFCEAGRGIPSTYRLSPAPSFRIDYILHDKNISSKTYSVHNDIDFSDHYPVSSVIDIADID